MTVVAHDADAQVVALACSAVAGPGGPRPLTAREWSALARQIHGSPLERPRGLLGLSGADLRAALGISAEAAARLHALLARGGQLAIELERLASRGIWLLTRADEAYPALLRRRLGEQAPPVLYGAGREEVLRQPALAVVGSRDASEEALAFADRLGALAASQGFAIVSGAARGVDTVAMQGALAADGRAVGVTVDPLERMVRRRELRDSLEAGALVLVTPFHPSARWHAGNAMRRNRLIYALSQAAVVAATAAGRGGTWTGAVENLRHGWVPLWVRDDVSQGGRALVGEGARPLRGQSMGGLRLHALTVSEATLLDAPEVASSTEPATPSPSAGLFDSVWPAIAEYLREPRTADDVASHFGLVRAQSRAWLTRAVEERRAEVRSRPRRYLVAGDSEQQPALFRD